VVRNSCTRETCDATWIDTKKKSLMNVIFVRSVLVIQQNWNFTRIPTQQ
jgi:hypothetical protein